MAKITDENRKELKSLIIRLRKINHAYAVGYRQVINSLLAQYVMLLFWLAHVVLYCVIPISSSYVWLFICGATGLFLGVFISSLRFRKHVFSPLKHLYKRGNDILEKLMTFVDWTVYRKQQLYKDTDARVEQVIGQFLSLSGRKLSPKNNFAAVLSAIALILSVILLFVSIICFENTFFKRIYQDIVLDAPKAIILSLLLLALLWIITLLVLFVLLRVRVTDTFEDKLSDLSAKITSFCKLSKIYAILMYSNDAKTFHPAEELIAKFAGMLDFETNDEFVDLEYFDSKGIESVFLDLNRLRYRIEENDDIIEKRWVVDEEMLGLYKDEIDSLLLSIYGHPVMVEGGYTSLAKAANQIYTSLWEPNKEIPHAMYHFQILLKQYIAISVVFVLFVGYFFCSKLIRTEDVSVWLNAIVVCLIYTTSYSMYASYRRLKSAIRKLVWVGL